MGETNCRRALALLITGSVITAPVFAAPDAIGFNGVLPSLNKVEIESAQVYDYTFAAAPVDWRVQSGKWAMTNRWTCAPQWSWFGGRSEEIAAIWNKRKFSGDFSVQVYFAFKEGINGSPPRWPERHTDVAISFCGDGQNLGSGYSLIIGADDNLHTILLKQGAIIAESAAPDALFSSFADGRLSSGFSSFSDGSLSSGRGSASAAGSSGGSSGGRKISAPVTFRAYGQTDWWYAKINKIGDHIECWLANKLLFEYDDPQPLDVGQFALWTYNNGIVLSRVQIFYENELKKVPETEMLQKVAIGSISPDVQR